MSKKTCGTCKKSLHFSFFYKRPSGISYESDCKNCKKEKVKMFRFGKQNQKKTKTFCVTGNKMLNNQFLNSELQQVVDVFLILKEWRDEKTP